MSLAEDYAASSEAQALYSDLGQRAFEAHHPEGRPAVFYRHFEDGSFVQASVTRDGAVTIEHGGSYNDAEAQAASEKALHDQLNAGRVDG